MGRGGSYIRGGRGVGLLGVGRGDVHQPAQTGSASAQPPNTTSPPRKGHPAAPCRACATPGRHPPRLPAVTPRDSRPSTPRVVRRTRKRARAGEREVGGGRVCLCACVCARMRTRARVLERGGWDCAYPDRLLSSGGPQTRPMGVAAGLYSPVIGVAGRCRTGRAEACGAGRQRAGGIE
jgi:hypothetical protein